MKYMGLLAILSTACGDYELTECGMMVYLETKHDITIKEINTVERLTVEYAGHCKRLRALTARFTDQALYAGKQRAAGLFFYPNYIVVDPRTDCLPDTAFIHELTHFYQDVISKQPSDYGHNDSSYWGHRGMDQTLRAQARGLLCVSMTH